MPVIKCGGGNSGSDIQSFYIRLKTKDSSNNSIYLTEACLMACGKYAQIKYKSGTTITIVCKEFDGDRVTTTYNQDINCGNDTISLTILNEIFPDLEFSASAISTGTGCFYIKVKIKNNMHYSLTNPSNGDGLNAIYVTADAGKYCERVLNGNLSFTSSSNYLTASNSTTQSLGYFKVL